jgi:uncharacterized protein
MQFSNYIPRNIKIPEHLSFFLFGSRQTGKSVLIDRRFPNRCWKIDLLQSEVYLEYLKAPHLFRLHAETKIIGGSVDIIVIDEVQKIPALLSEVHDLMQRFPKIRFVLTGSSARKLRRGGSDMLAGRAASCYLFPLTLAEMADLFNLDSVLKFGSLPSLIGKTDEEKRQILSAYVETYLREEIKAEGIARNLSGFSRFLDVAASQCGELVNTSAIGRECRLAQKTVEGYYEILDDTLIGFRLEPWHKSLRKRLSTHPRFYLFDTGVTNALNRRLTAGLDPMSKGKLFEQFIICEVLRAVRYSGSEARMYYWRTSNGAEVDLVIEKHGSLIAAIEIKSFSHVSGADCTGLRAFHDDNPATPLLLICDAANRFDLSGIAVIPWKEWILNLKQWL